MPQSTETQHVQRIIVHGSLAYDRIMVYPQYFKDSILPDKIHQISVSFNIEEMKEMRGGTGGNIVYNLALLNQSPTLISSIGKNGAPYIELLKSKGVDISAVDAHQDILTAAFSVVTDRANNQIGAFFVGAAARPTQFDFSQLDPQQTLVILAPANNIPDTMKYVAQCKEKKLRYIFDPGQTISALTAEQLQEGISGSWMYIVNDYELELTMQKTTLSEEDILQLTDVLTVTLGAKGSVIKQRGKENIHIPAFQQDRLLDPTGAGDAYRAGIAAGYALELPLENMGRLAACAASFAIEQIGTQEHAYSIEQFRKRYQENTQQDCPI